MNNMNAENVIIYLRKSRSDDPSTPITEVLMKHERDLQEYALREWGVTIPEERIFREIVSGETIDARPMMIRIIEMLENNSSICGVLVIEPQRLSRGDLMDCGRIINTFRYTNTLVITPPKAYNLADEYDRKFFEMELMRGNDYLEYTKRILNRGRVASVKQGNYIGSVAPYGYEKVVCGSGKDKYHSLQIIPAEAAAVRLMFHMYTDEDCGFTKIARHLDSLGIKPRHSSHWSPAAIGDMLNNPVYAGWICWDRRKVVKGISDGHIVYSRPNSNEPLTIQGRHEPIIDTETFNRAKELRGKHPKIKRFNELQNPLAGLLHCGTCGTAMSLKKYVDKRSKTGTVTACMLCNQQSICHTRSVMYVDVIDRLTQVLKDEIADFEISTADGSKKVSAIRNQIIDNMRSELNKLKVRDSRQKDAYEDGIYTKEDFLLRNAKLHEQIAELERSIAQATEELTQQTDYEAQLTRFRDALHALTDDTISASERNMLLKQCISKISYTSQSESRVGIGRFAPNSFNLDVFFKL